MYLYFCVENEKLVSVLNYKPSVPPAVTVVGVHQEQVALAENGTHFFDPKTMKMVPYPEGNRPKLVSPKPQPQDHVCIPVNTSSTPVWADGDLIFSYETTDTGLGVLSVINNTGHSVTASASTNVGQFSEVCIDSETEYRYECKYSDSPMGFLMFVGKKHQEKVSK